MKFGCYSENTAKKYCNNYKNLVYNLLSLSVCLLWNKNINIKTYKNKMFSDFPSIKEGVGCAKNP